MVQTRPQVMDSFGLCPARLDRLRSLVQFLGATGLLTTYLKRSSSVLDASINVLTEVQAAEAAKEVAEQRFWLPLERSKGRQMGELCVSLLFTKVGRVAQQ